VPPPNDSVWFWLALLLLLGFAVAVILIATGTLGGQP
jgi:hypothetical protein